MKQKVDASATFNNNLVYNGEKQDLFSEITFKFNGANIEIAAEDYDISYEKDGSSCETPVDAGEYTVYISLKEDSNYVLETQLYELGKVKISPKPVFVESVTKEYDGSNISTNTEATLEGVIDKDKELVTATAGTVDYGNADVGSYNNVAVSNVILGGSGSGNYVWKQDNNSAAGTITPRKITVSAVNAEKTYGETDPELTYEVAEATPLVAGETLSDITVSRSAGENVDVYELTVGQTKDANPNYEITFEEGGTFTIKKKELKVNVDVQDKQYDGLVNASFNASLVGVVEKDKGVVTLDDSNVTATFMQATVGEQIDVSLNGNFDLEGDNGIIANYELIQPAKNYKAEIYNTYDASEYIVTPDNWTNGTVTITPSEGYLISTGNTDTRVWNNELTYSDETVKEGKTVSFYIRNSDTKVISLEEKVTYFIDKTLPAFEDFSITFNENQVKKR